jgi:hypothetical protein
MTPAGVTDRHGVLRTQLTPPAGTTSVYNVAFAIFINGHQAAPPSPMKVSCPFPKNDPTAANVGVTFLHNGKPIARTKVSIASRVVSFQASFSSIPEHFTRTNRQGVAQWKGLPTDVPGAKQQWSICVVSPIYCQLVTLPSGDNNVTINVP